MTVLITGVAGFIGFHLAQRLLSEGIEILGIDNLNPYYDVALKQARLSQLQNQTTFRFQYLDLADRDGMKALFEDNSFTHVIHLAAQAGVRYSIHNPMTYIDSNLVGFSHILEGCRYQDSLDHLIYASSSSVYGANHQIPFRVTDTVDQPLSLYAATKKANELMAHCYSHLYHLPTTGLRFFTVYGPWGRPDMAYFKFVRAIEADHPIEIYNYGRMKRDFTYIDDIIEGIRRLLDRPPHPQHQASAPYRIYNIGNNQPTELGHLIATIEQVMGKTAQKIYLPMQPGDVPITYADVDDLVAEVGFKPSTSIEQGIEAFVRWYQTYSSSETAVAPAATAIRSISLHPPTLKAS